MRGERKVKSEEVETRRALENLVRPVQMKLRLGGGDDSCDGSLGASLLAKAGTSMLQVQTRTCR